MERGLGRGERHGRREVEAGMIGGEARVEEEGGGGEVAAAAKRQAGGWAVHELSCLISLAVHAIWHTTVTARSR